MNAVALIIVYFVYEMLLPRTMTISDDNEPNNVHCCQSFFTCYLQRMTMLLLVFYLAFAAQLVVIFFLFFIAANGSLLIFCYR
jgi:hypothetical protein